MKRILSGNPGTTIIRDVDNETTKQRLFTFPTKVISLRFYNQATTNLAFSNEIS